MLRASDGHRLLLSLPAVSLDTETTGLDVTLDRVISIGALRLNGSTILREETFHQLVKPDIPIPESSIAIHGITDDRVASAPVLAEVLPRVGAFCGERVIIGHNTAFDLAILRYESARCQKAWLNGPWLDTGLLAIALNPALGNAGLESIASWLGVPIEGRHTAPGDALMAAEIFVRLIPQLRDAGVRTLAEAQRFQETAAGALAMQRAAGWFSVWPESKTAAPATAALERIDSFPYRHRVGEVMSSPPIVVPPDTPLLGAVARMRESKVGALLVGDPQAYEGHGIFTERDLVSAIALRGTQALAATVGEFTNYPLVCLEHDAFVYRALGRMQRLDLRHLGVRDERGLLVGVVSIRSALQIRTTRAILVGDRIAAARNAYELAAAADELPTLAKALLGEGIAAIQVTAVISDVVRQITARAAALAEQQLAAQGYGPAPVPWCLLVLGSAGRGESLLSPDQDNAIVYLGSHLHDPWFAALAQRLVDILDQAGIPYCKGEVMANNPAWRRNLGAWREEIERWARLESESSVANINAFYDFEPVHGAPRIASELRDIAVNALKTHEYTLVKLAHAVARMRPPIGRFGRFEIKDERLELKAGAILPLVAAARILALSHGSSARATSDRLREASAGTLLPAAEIKALIDIHALLVEVILKQQLEDLHHGIPVSDRVEIRALNAETTRALRSALRHLDEFLIAIPEFRIRL